MSKWLKDGAKNAEGWVGNIFILIHVFRSGYPSAQVTAAFSSSWPQNFLRSTDFLLATSMSLQGAKGSFCYSHDLEALLQ